MAFPNVNIQISISRWLEQTQDQRSYFNNPKILTILEKENFVAQCLSYIESQRIKIHRTNTYAILQKNHSFQSDIKGLEDTQAVMFIQKINSVPIQEQQAIYSAWVNSLSPKWHQRFAISIILFRDEFEQISKYDLWSKLDDMSIIIG